MRKDKFLDSMEHIDAKLIEEAAEYKPAAKLWYKSKTAAAACLCVAALGVFALAWNGSLGSNSANSNSASSSSTTAGTSSGNLSNGYESTADSAQASDAAGEDSSISNKPSTSAESAEEAAGGTLAQLDPGEATVGVTIPAIQLPESTDAESAGDMIALVVYKGAVYTGYGMYYDWDAAEKLLDEHLGTAKGNIDEWSTQDDYATELASNMTGEVYTVKGYDPDFRLAIVENMEDEDGKNYQSIQFFDHLNGITLTMGSDLFEDLLHIGGRIVSAKWQSHADWNEAKEVYHELDITTEAWQDFLAELDNGNFVYMWTGNVTDRTIYQKEKQHHIYFTLDDGTIVPLRLIEGGYVGYDNLGWYFVEMPGASFDAIMSVSE